MTKRVFEEPKMITTLTDKDKTTIVNSLHKIADDLDKIELAMIETKLEPDKALRFKQFIVANKTRIKHILWGLHGSGFKDLEELGGN